MEVKKFVLLIILLYTLISCSNAPEFETGEIKTIQLLKDSFAQNNKPKVFISSRSLLSRAKVDEFASPILFVELESGQNGTLTKYPGKGIGKTWLGADGATVTTDHGILIATRGMGDDLMGATAPTPPWIDPKNYKKTYTKKLSYLDGVNTITLLDFQCGIEKFNKKIGITIWEVSFPVHRYEEICTYKKMRIKNVYYIDDNATVRQSFQYHGKTLGYLLIQRLDR